MPANNEIKSLQPHSSVCISFPEVLRLQWKEVRGMYFVIRNSSDGLYFFTINAANHQVLCSSEIYTKKQAAMDAIAVIKAGVGAAQIHDYTV